MMPHRLQAWGSLLSSLDASALQKSSALNSDWVVTRFLSCKDGLHHLSVGSGRRQLSGSGGAGWEVMQHGAGAAAC